MSKPQIYFRELEKIRPSLHWKVRMQVIIFFRKAESAEPLPMELSEAIQIMLVATMLSMGMRTSYIKAVESNILLPLLLFVFFVGSSPEIPST